MGKRDCWLKTSHHTRKGFYDVLVYNKIEQRHKRSKTGGSFISFFTAGSLLKNIYVTHNYFEK